MNRPILVSYTTLSELLDCADRLEELERLPEAAQVARDEADQIISRMYDRTSRRREVSTLRVVTE